MSTAVADDVRPRETLRLYSYLDFDSHSARKNPTAAVRAFQAAFPAGQRDVQRVEHDQHVQQPGHNHEGIAVLIGNGHDSASGHSRCPRDEVGNPHADVGERHQRHERLSQIKWEQLPFEPEPEEEHR